MKMIKYSIMWAISMCLLAAVAPTRTLASTYADVWSGIEWATLNISFTGSGAVSKSQIYTEAGIETADGTVITDSDMGNTSATTESVAEIDAANYWGWGLSDGEDLYSGSFIDDADNTYSGLSYGSAGYSGTYTADSDGVLTISFDYYLGYGVVTDSSEYASAQAMVELLLGTASDCDALSVEAFNGMAYGSETPPGMTMILTLDLSGGESADFSILASTQAEVSPVPLPGAIWLLASVLPGIAVIRRKKA